MIIPKPTSIITKYHETEEKDIDLNKTLHTMSTGTQTEIPFEDSLNCNDNKHFYKTHHSRVSKKSNHDVWQDSLLFSGQHDNYTREKFNETD